MFEATIHFLKKARKYDVLVADHCGCRARKSDKAVDYLIRCKSQEQITNFVDEIAVKLFASGLCLRAS